MSKRAEDLERLEEVLEQELSTREQEVFSEMLEWIQAGESRALSEKQRTWLAKVYEREHPTYENLYSSGKVPKGNDVPTPAVLQNLPKFPPGRGPKTV